MYPINLVNPFIQVIYGTRLKTAAFPPMQNTESKQQHLRHKK